MALAVQCHRDRQHMSLSSHPCVVMVTRPRRALIPECWTVGHAGDRDDDDDADAAMTTDLHALAH